MGYHRAGFEVVGVDIEPQPYYPFEFHQADALTFPLDGFDAIHASPPCQGYSTMSNRFPLRQATYPKLIGPIRERLRLAGVPWVIENVEGAAGALIAPVRICGQALGLPIKRHRLFESSVSLMVPPCACGMSEIIGVYGRAPDGRRLNSRASGTIHYAAASLDEARAAMEIPWADWHGVKEAIPPSYTEIIGLQLLRP